MPRRYAGPLLPGQRTAKVFMGSKRRRKTTNKPSRLVVSASRAEIDKAVSKKYNSLTGNKFQGYSLECGQPSQKPAGDQPISYFFFNAGEQLDQPANSVFTPMNLFSFPKGDNNNERTGDYMFLKKSHLKMEIQMLPTNSSVSLQGLQSTTQFRFMIVKANRKYNKLGVSPIAGSSLFLTTENDQFGFGIAGQPSTASTFSNMSQPINKRKWIVYKDTKFTLSTPAQQFTDTSIPDSVTSIDTSNSKYPVKKLLKIDLPIYKKTHFDSESTVPDSVDTQWLLVIQACPTNYCTEGVQAPRNIRLNILGTTSASDN